jgi:hypothetical protein
VMWTRRRQCRGGGVVVHMHFHARQTEKWYWPPEMQAQSTKLIMRVSPMFNIFGMVLSGADASSANLLNVFHEDRTGQDVPPIKSIKQCQ